MLRDLQPEKFVDADTWQVREFQTSAEKLVGETLPRAAQAAGWALRAGAFLLAASSPAALAVGVVSGIAALSAIKFKRNTLDGFVESIWDGRYIEDNRVFNSYDVGKQIDAELLVKKLGPVHASFVDEYKKICAVAGFDQPPRIVIAGDRVKVWSKKYPSDVAEEVETKNQDNFIFGAVTKADGSKPLIVIGERAPPTLTASSLRVIIGHELTHIALKHPQKSAHSGVMTGGLVFAACAVVAGIATFSAPLFAVAGLATGLFALDAFAGSVVSRYNEKVCDRGAALITGETLALASGLKKLGDKMLRAKRLEDEYYKDAQKTLWRKLRDPIRKWWRNTELGKKINDSHPEDDVREKLLASYRHHGEDRHYLNWRAEQFRGAFLKAAVKPDLGQPAAQTKAAPARPARSGPAA